MVQSNQLSRSLSGFILAGLSTVAFGQESIRSERQAIDRASQLLTELNRELQLSNARVARTSLGSTGRHRWTVLAENDSVYIAITDPPGVVTGFADIDLQSEALERVNGTWSLHDERAVWLVADSFMGTSGLVQLGMQRAKIDWPKISATRGNGKDIAVARFEQRVDAYPGSVNMASVSVDLVSGRVVAAAASASWTYDAPSIVRSEVEAASVASDLFRTEAARLVSDGKPEQARRFRWPDASEPQPDFELRVERGGASCLGSDHGQVLTTRRLARLCWVAWIGSVRLALDAESLLPVSTEFRQGTEQSVQLAKAEALARARNRPAQAGISAADATGLAVAGSIVVLLAGSVLVARRIEARRRSPGA